ncbi:DUF4738 domain-containing protein [Aquimarina spongiae]|uniref:DUF4738 domain-containing protein n=1 Tax=Aquimarina spongiae TaxID=570521 RepID=A0A1M6I2H4_9FLAO|nr:DUF4738 domain-containing protein [Aquimarina spongiae]SHJ28434.1 protein of unknown function [Aquimarina spongiae]
MRISLLILVSFLFVLSCKSESKTDLSNSSKDTIEEGKLKNQVNPKIKDSIIEKFFPDTKDPIKNDTLIQNRGIRISIVQTPLDSYVVNEFNSDGIKNIHKYRDFENHLIIETDSKILTDTVFRKVNFLENTGQEFQEISVFHGYWFSEIKDNQIELFGILSKPETDYSFGFQHFFDITSGEFKIQPSIEEDY